MTKHKYGNVIDYKITVDEKLSTEMALQEIKKHGKMIKEIIESKVLIFSVSKSRVDEFKELIQIVEPFGSFQTYSLDLGKEKEYFCFDYSIDKIPVVQSTGEVISCMSVVSFKYGRDFFLVFVKDKFKSFYANIGGSSLFEESAEDCILREIKEEIGLIVGEDSMVTAFGKMKKKTKIPVLGTTFKNNIIMYNVSISERNARNWLNNRGYSKYFNPKLPVNIIRTKNDEIEKIALVKIDENIFISEEYKIELRNISDTNLDLISVCYELFYGVKNVKKNRSKSTIKMDYMHLQNIGIGTA